MTPASHQPLLPAARHLFDIPAGIAYFDVASLAPTLRAGVAAGQRALQRRAQPWRIGAADWFDGAERRRALFAQLIGAPAGSVALVPATSYGMAVAATNLPAGPGQRILVLAEEYPSGVYTWTRFARRTGATLRTVRREPGQGWADAVLDALDERVAVVSVPQVHWIDGALVDLDRIAPRVRELGAKLVVDASQSAGAMPIDVGVLRPDFLVTVGYKWLLGPFGLAYMYVDEVWHEGQPIEENWILREGSEEFARLIDYPDAYQPGARRFDVGARTELELTPMAIAALEQLHAWGVANIAATLRVVTATIERHARDRGLGVPAERGAHMLGVHVPDPPRGSLLAALTGADVHVGARGSALRISPHLHTSDHDVARLLAALDR
jgi:selenocysteine lyase/cysteine desulfurase